MRSPKGRKGAKKNDHLQEPDNKKQVKLRSSSSSPKEAVGSTKASPTGKRVKAPQNQKSQSQSQSQSQIINSRQAADHKAAEPEPEVFPEHRNLEDLWKAAFPVGTEWHLLDSVYQFKWDFSNLEKAFEEGGELYGKRVYLFGCTEPQLVHFQGQKKIICIPAIVAVTSPFPPSDEIGIKSVQREEELIVPMKRMKMDWVPYIPLENRHNSPDRLKSQIFTLQCMQRRVALKHLKQEDVKKYEYCLPHFYQPFKEDEVEIDTVVQIMYPLEPPIVCAFDWEFDEIEEFTEKLISEGVLAAEQNDEFQKFLKEKVTESKQQQREAKAARKKAIEQMSPERKAAFQNMRFYKFYPVHTPDTPDVSGVKSPFINRYYGRAHMVF